MVRAMLSESLKAVISQSLLKTKDGNGRVAAHEIMIGTPAIRNLIREAKVSQMNAAIQTGARARHADPRPVPDRPGPAQRHLDGTRRAPPPPSRKTSRPDPRRMSTDDRTMSTAADTGRPGHTRRCCRAPRRRLAPASLEREQASKFLHDLLRLMVAKKGSDLFLTAEFPPAFKIDGKLMPVSNVAADRAAHRPSWRGR